MSLYDIIGVNGLSRYCQIVYSAWQHYTTVRKVSGKMLHLKAAAILVGSLLARSGPAIVCIKYGRRRRPFHQRFYVFRLYVASIIWQWFISNHAKGLTRRREKMVGQFKSHQRALRFLFAHDQINLIFRPDVTNSPQLHTLQPRRCIQPLVRLRCRNDSIATPC